MTPVLMRAREITGRPVVTLDGAEDVAEVKDVVISHAAAGVLGFTLNRRGFLGSPLKEVLPWEAVSALGRDAVMVEGAGALGAPDEEMGEAAGAGRDDDVVGAAVMTDGGVELGTVVDVIVEVDDRDAAVVGFEVHGPGVSRDRDAATLLIPIDDTLAVSGSALMVPVATEGFVRDDLSGFGSAVADFRARLREPAP
ncbi:MAG: PRC-barrel domain-containing protein [Thermoleophilia bacterium]